MKNEIINTIKIIDTDGTRIEIEIKWCGDGYTYRVAKINKQKTGKKQSKKFTTQKEVEKAAIKKFDDNPFVS